MRLFDMLQKYDKDNALKGAPVIVGDNVSKYYTESTKKFWDIIDFPNILPPVTRIFVEAKSPKFMKSEDFGITKKCKRITFSWGVLLDSHEIGSQRAREICNQVNLAPDQTLTWVVEGRLFALIDSEVIIGPKLNFGLDGEGKLSIIKGRPFFYMNHDEDNINSDLSERHMLMWTSMLKPLLLTIYFMSCKEVEIFSVVPPFKLSAKHQRKTGKPLSRYYQISDASIQILKESVVV